MFSDETEAKTMWSESLLESLYTTLRRGGNDATVLEIVKDLRAKKYEDIFLVNKVQQKLGSKHADRLRGMLGMPVGPKPRARKARSAKASAAGSGLQSLLRLLGKLWDKLTRA